MGQEALSEIVWECACHPSWLGSADEATCALCIGWGQKRAPTDSPSALLLSCFSSSWTELAP